MTVLSQSIDLNINDVTQKITLSVNIIGYKGWLLRLKVGIFFIRLACWIANINVEFK